MVCFHVCHVTRRYVCPARAIIVRPHVYRKVLTDLRFMGVELYIVAFHVLFTIHQVRKPNIPRSIRELLMRGLHSVCNFVLVSWSPQYEMGDALVRIQQYIHCRSIYSVSVRCLCVMGILKKKCQRTTCFNFVLRAHAGARGYVISHDAPGHW